MTSPWTAGLQIRGLDDTPIADFLCGHCGAHKRVTGRIEVAKFTATNPAVDHATRCNPSAESHPEPPAATASAARHAATEKAAA
ncbi:transcription factor WhiB [Streptomyces sp. NPDC001315]|uniref:transcription factor WhiB n=1 Tax=Streptomyces sp. NPDC001315 TaxID=3364562 RepID=UPI003692C37E